MSKKVEKKVKEVTGGTTNKDFEKFQLELFRDYFVTADRYQFILNRRYPNEKTGEMEIEKMGYYSRLSTLVERLVEMELKRSEVRTVEELNHQMLELRRLIRKTFPEFKIIED